MLLSSKLKHYRLTILGVIATCLLACTQELTQFFEENNTENSARNSIEAKNKMTDDTKFLNISINSENKNKCSPIQADPSWRGIIINAPQRVYINIANRDDVIGYAVVPICGYSRLEVLKARNAGPMILVAKNLASGEVFDGPIVPLEPDEDIEPIPPEIADIPPFTDAELKGIAVGDYFNPNLTQLVAIPKTPGKYEVKVTLGEFTSNVVKVEFFE